MELEIGYPGEAWLKGVPPAINTLIERGLVDEKQVGVYGQSYGGYAVNLLVTQTDRFAAAANVSGKVNIISFLGDSEKITTRNYNAAEEGQDRIGATLWEQPQKYIATSAVMFADRIETPLLLMSGEGDWNVPATNQREMYYALRRLGKEVVWVNYMQRRPRRRPGQHRGGLPRPLEAAARLHAGALREGGGEAHRHPLTGPRQKNLNQMKNRLKPAKKARPTQLSARIPVPGCSSAGVWSEMIRRKLR